MSDSLNIELDDRSIKLAAKIIHKAGCARAAWKEGMNAKALIYWDRADEDMGRLFKHLGDQSPEVIQAIEALADDVNEGK